MFWTNPVVGDQHADEIEVRRFARLQSLDPDALHELLFAGDDERDLAAEDFGDGFGGVEIVAELLLEKRFFQNLKIDFFKKEIVLRRTWATIISTCRKYPQTYAQRTAKSPPNLPEYGQIRPNWSQNFTPA